MEPKTQYEKNVERMRAERPDVPDAVWDIEASEEMAQMWDEHCADNPIIED